MAVDSGAITRSARHVIKWLAVIKRVDLHSKMGYHNLTHWSRNRNDHVIHVWHLLKKNIHTYIKLKTMVIDFRITISIVMWWKFFSHPLYKGIKRWKWKISANLLIGQNITLYAWNIYIGKTAEEIFLEKKLFWIIFQQQLDVSKQFPMWICLKCVCTCFVCAILLCRSPLQMVPPWSVLTCSWGALPPLATSRW